MSFEDDFWGGVKHSDGYPAVLWVWFVIQVLRSEICPHQAESDTYNRALRLLEFPASFETPFQ